MLYSLGIPHNLYGFKYLYSSILYSLEYYETNLSVTKNIYPYVAKQYKKSSSSIERKIRYAISKSIILHEKNSFYKTELNIKNHSNSDIIYGITNYIRANKSQT